MSSLFQEVSEKALEKVDKDIVIAEKINPVLGAIGVASAIATQQTPNLHQNFDKMGRKLQTIYTNRIDKAIKAEQLQGEYGIVFTDEHGNKLIRRGGDISVLANNPGNICKPRDGFGPKNQGDLIAMGAIGFFYGEEHVYAIFPDLQTGQYALRNWLNSKDRAGWSVNYTMHKFAPANCNDTENYIRFIEKHGVNRRLRLRDLNSNQREQMVKAITKMEGTNPVKSEEFIPNTFKLSNMIQKASVNESKNINTKKAPLYIAKSIDDICLTMKQHKLNTVKVSYDSSIDTYIFGDTYNYVHWSLISTAIKNGLYADTNMDDLVGNIDVLGYTNKLDNFAISVLPNSKDLIEDSLEVKLQFESYGNTYYIYRNDIDEKFKALNESSIPMWDDNIEDYITGAFYCFTGNELQNILDNNLHHEDARVIYEFNKGVYLLTESINAIHNQILEMAIMNTKLFDSLGDIKQIKEENEGQVTLICEEARKYLDLISFKIFRNMETDTDEQFLEFLVRLPDNWTDDYSEGFACKLNNTTWAICRYDEINKVKQIPVFNGKEWISLKEINKRLPEDEEELNESQEEVKKIIAYHGSQQKRIKFNKDKVLYLTRDYNQAKSYATREWDEGLIEGEIPVIFKYEVSIKKPFITDGSEDSFFDFCDGMMVEEGRKNELIAQGYDSIIHNDFIGVFYEKQLKLLDTEILPWNPKYYYPEDGGVDWEDKEDYYYFNEHDNEDLNESVEKFSLPNENSLGQPIAKDEESLRNFWKWFGNSKVVDEKGRPQVVYHGTDTEFDTFDKEKIGKNYYQSMKGFYFTDKTNYFGEINMPVYLFMKNPLIIHVKDYAIESFEDNRYEYFMDVEDNNNDGIIVKSKAKSDKDLYLVFEPNQIKSVANKGTFNSNSDNIYESVEEDDNKTWIDIEDIVSEYNVYDVLSLFQEENPWNPLIDAGQYKKALEEFVKTGKLLRTPTSLIENWFEIIVRNTRILTITTELSGHTQWFPFEEVKDYYFGDDELSYQEFLLDNKVEKDVSDFEIGGLILDKKGFYEKMVLPDGSDAISDYGLKPLYNIIYEYKEGMTAEEVLVLINKALDVIHCRGDLASAFITGGRDTLTSISNESKKETKKPLYESKQLNKKVIAYHGSQTDKLQFMKNHALYLTNNYDLAYEFATKDGDGGLVSGEVATLYTCELNLKKVYETHSEAEYDTNFVDVSFNREKWLEKGYNAIIIHPIEGSKTTYYIMLNPEEDVKIINKEVIDSGDDVLNESKLLNESLVKSKTILARLVNNIDFALKKTYKLELVSDGDNLKNKQIKDSYYVIVSNINTYKDIKFPTHLKFRCSNHIKTKNREDIDVFVPNEEEYNDKYLLADNFTYLFNDVTIVEYQKTAVSDIKQKMNNLYTKIKNQLEAIDEDYYLNYRMYDVSDRYKKYENIYNDTWFRNFIAKKEEEYVRQIYSKSIGTSRTLHLPVKQY